MKLIIEIPIDLLERTKSGDYDFGDDLARNEVIANGIPYNPTGGLTEAEKIICKVYLEDLDKTHTCNEYKLLMSLIDNAQAIPERPKGRWKLVIRDNQDIDVVCPFCNRTRFPAYSHGYMLEELEEYLIRHHLPKFCEHCGADMRGDAE